MTYSDAKEEALNLMSFMKAEGMQQHGRCGVFGQNSPEWFLVMQACNAMSVYCVPLYDTMGEENVEYIIRHSESTMIFVQDQKLAALANILPQCPNVTTVVYWGQSPDKSAIERMEKQVRVYSYQEAKNKMKNDRKETSPPSSNDLCTIMYTSGTTGEPKGVMLTHNAVASMIAGADKYMEQVGIKFTSDDVFLSYLPLAHIMDRVLEEFMIYVGASIVYWRGDVRKLTEDIGIVKPTLFAGVPRIFDRVYNRAMDQINSSAIKRTLFNWAFPRKKAKVDSGIPSDKATPFLNTIIFNKMRDRLGGRVRAIVSGAAPLANHVEDFLRVCMCCPVVQGYGLTETTAASFIGIVDNPSSSSTVGAPTPACKFKLESIPEMNYDATKDPPQGEICIGGPANFIGYYKKQQETDESVEKDTGFFHTGDVGEVTNDGFLRIIDRKKNIFKLSQGEYIAVEKVENVYGKAETVEQIWVYGSSYTSYLVAVVVPTEDALQKKTGVKDSLPSLCNREESKQAVLKDLDAIAESEGLKTFERVKRVHLEPEPFSIEKNLLTPTYKKKRPQLKDHYKDIIDKLYKE